MKKNDNIDLLSPSPGTDENIDMGKEHALLLAISNELSAVRSNTDLLHLINHSLNNILHFNHAVITLNDHVQQSYIAYIYDHNAPISHHPDYNRHILHAFPMQDAVMTPVNQSNDPVVFDVDQLMDNTASPAWLRMSHDGGIHEALVVRLATTEQPLGAFIILADQHGRFRAQHIQFIKKIAYQLSNVLANLVSNREIRQQEYEKSTLLSISNKMAAIRSKNDLLEMLEEKLKKLMPISHTLTSRFSKDGKRYFAYILDPRSPCRGHKNYNDLVQSKPTTEGLIDLVLLTEQPVLFDVAEVLKHPNAPEFLKINHECGIRQIICSAFGNGNRKTGFLTIFINPATYLHTNEQSLLLGVTAQLSTAIANIIANEEILEGEKEKSSLLVFSNELAGVRDEHGLNHVITNGLKNMFRIGEYLLSVMNPDKTISTHFLYDQQDSNYARDHRFENIKGKNIVITDNLAEAVSNSSGSVTFNMDYLLRPGKLKMDSAGFWKSVGMNTIQGIPLRAGDQVIGVLWTFNKHELNERLMSGVSSLIAVALANTLANEKIENQLAQISKYKQQLEVENRYLQEEIETAHNYSEIVGSSPAMKKVFEMISQVSATESSVLILGETGTGKELIARALHNASPRKHKLMVKVNCATLPPNLIESELFGHERGAFTGAVERRIGKFELANNSTLFLDEIGELPLDLQVKLLRALQEREIERVGGRGVIKVNVRIIAATNRNLHKEVHNGNFRSDLFFRLNVFPIDLPALRERREDIPVLAGHFLLKYARKNMKGKMAFSNKAIKQLTAYNWPGNVREMEHLIERTILVSQGNMIHQIALPVMESDEISQIFPDNHIKTIDEVEREHIIYVLKKCNGRVAGIGGAAAVLKIPSTTLNSKIKRLNIKKGLAGF